MNVAYNIDCMDYMKAVPDKYFDLAVVDPPYGGGGKPVDGEICGGGGRLRGQTKKPLWREV